MADENWNRYAAQRNEPRASQPLSNYEQYLNNSRTQTRPKPATFSTQFAKPAPNDLINKFLNHCATIIQSRVRGYLQRKRDAIILPRIRRFKALLLAVIKRYRQRHRKQRKQPTKTNKYDEQPIGAKRDQQPIAAKQRVARNDQPIAPKNYQRDNNWDEQPIGRKNQQPVDNWEEQPISSKNWDEQPIGRKNQQLVENWDEQPISSKNWDEQPIGRGTKPNNWDDQPVGKKGFDAYDEQPMEDTSEPSVPQKKKKQDPKMSENLKKRTKYDPRKAALEGKRAKEETAGQETKVETKVESKAESKVETKAVSKPESKTESKMQSKVESKGESKTQSKAESKMDSKLESDLDPKDERKPAAYLKRKSKQVPLVRGKSSSKVESKTDSGVPDDGWRETAEEYPTTKHTSPKTYKSLRSPSKTIEPQQQQQQAARRIQIEDLERAYSSNYQQKFNSTMSQIQSLMSQRMAAQQQKIPIISVQSAFYRKFEPKNFEKLLNAMEEQYQILQA